MANVVDNLIAYRVLSMLVKPFKETKAYELGIIDENGKNLIRARNLTTIEQKNAYTYLHRLVFSLKRMLAKLPGGDSKLKSFVAALFLIKEARQQGLEEISEERFDEIMALLDNTTLVEEYAAVVDFFELNEEGPVNVTGPGTSTDINSISKPLKRKRKYKEFDVDHEVFRRFNKGKTKFSKWSNYLNLEDEGQKTIYKFAKQNPRAVIIIKNGKNVKSIRFNRTGGGRWSSIQRRSATVNNEVY